MQEQWLDLLRGLPVSVNNLADPSILKASTEAKMNTLVEDGHTGPVALITKGDLSSPWWTERLSYWASNLNLFVFASISHLPKEMEPAPTESRYRTLAAARNAGAKAIAYIRPIIHTINDSPEIISEMFQRSVDAGCSAIVSSGFRGDDQVVSEAGLKSVPAPDNQQWMRTLKLTPQSSADLMIDLADSLNIPYWTRTQCAVAALSGQPRSLNPYYVAPKFVGCDRCPLQNSCAGAAQFVQPVPGSVELLRHLGFQVEVHTASARYERCGVEVRSQCTLCCTNCPKAPDMGAPYLNIRAYDGSVPSWGEMSLARFLTGGLLATDPLIPPGENSNVRLHPRFAIPDGRADEGVYGVNSWGRLHPRFSVPDGTAGEGVLYGVNSWMVWSEYVPAGKCLKCSYCFLSMFEDVLPPELQVTVGMSPSRILQLERASGNPV
ncbi:MAG TPA: hypothetical protein V6D29_13700 [Leptolyngbyaceae cyanobacterium]